MTDHIIWHALSIEDTLKNLNSVSSGLSDGEAVNRLSEYGPNELIEQKKRKPWQIFFEQLTSTMVLILIGASVLSIFLGSYKDASAILAIVILFSILGFIQDYRAEKAMAALKKLAVPFVRVKRSGKIIEVPAVKLVPGDEILVEAGNIVPADCRLIEGVNLKVQESALTGESEPVEKDAGIICTEETALAEMCNSIFMGTIVTQGRGKAVVVSTGMKTELGKIASILQAVKQEPTPLQRRLDKLGKALALFGILISVIIIILGILRGESIVLLLLAGISVAVAVIPEGLPAVVTITLAIGAQRMLKRKSLIRKLPAVESLGSVTVICSDKTGTLTQNKMTVVEVNTIKEEIDFTKNKNADKCSLILTVASLCNDARLDGKGGFIGDPTEGALVVAAHEIGIDKDNCDKVLPRTAEIPFDSVRKRMSSIHKINDTAVLKAMGLNTDSAYISFIKGSVDGILGISGKVFIDGRETDLTATLRQQITDSNEQSASKGKRVLGMAYKKLDSPHANAHDVETDVVFIGMVSMIDPPRSEVKYAVAECKEAGITPVMITGDHPLTANYIASDLGITDHRRILTGTELDKMSFDELEEIVEEISVFARVSPEHKLKIVELLQKKGHIVAMTGDGVNDAPALKKADIGIAMGITGTDVSKEASDMVLLDDNFSTIVNAVEEGRIVYDNIKKFVKFSVAGNIGKVLVMLAGSFVWTALPLLPIQLLWLNLLTDGLLGFGLGMERGESNIMVRPPIKINESVFSNGGWLQVTLIGILIGLVSMGIGIWYYYQDSPAWQTMIFMTIAFCQVWQVLAVRSENDPSFSSSFLHNKTMAVMVISVIVLQLCSWWIPSLKGFLRIYPISYSDILISVACSSIIFIFIELQKIVRSGGKQM